MPENQIDSESGEVKTRVRRQSTVITIDPSTESKTTSAVVTDTEVAALPDSVTMACPFGYYEDDGASHWWNGGQVVTDASAIADLTARGAIFTADA